MQQMAVRQTQTEQGIHRLEAVVKEILDALKAMKEGLPVQAVQSDDELTAVEWVCYVCT